MATLPHGIPDVPLSQREEVQCGNLCICIRTRVRLSVKTLEITLVSFKTS